MNLTFSGHDDRYAVEQLLMSLLGQQEITVSSRLSRGKVWLTAITEIEMMFYIHVYMCYMLY